MNNIATELKHEVLAQADIIADLEAQTIAQARTIREQAVIIREHQAADVLAVEAIQRLTAELTQCKHALDDEGEDLNEMCKCGHYLGNHRLGECVEQQSDGYICECNSFEAAK